MTEMIAHDDTPPPANRAARGLMAADPATVRRAVWVAFAGFVGAYVLLSVAPLPDRIGYALGQWVWVLLCACAAGGAGTAARMTRSIERRFWLFMAVAAGFIFASQTYYSWFVSFVDRQGPVAPSISSLLDLGAVGTFVVLLATLTRFRNSSVAAQARYVVDNIAVSLIVVVVLYHGFIGPWFDSMGVATPAAKLLNAGYPIVGAHILIGAVRSILGTRIDRWESWERLVAAGLACFAFGLVFYPLSYASSRFGFFSPYGSVIVEVAWIVGLYLVLAAAVYRHTTYERVWRLRPLPVIETTRGWVPSVIMPSIEILAIPAFGVAAFLSGEPDARTAFTGAVVLVASLLGARTLLTVSDNGELFTRAIGDPLTGLFNHRHFHHVLAGEIAAAERYGEAVSVIVLDLDDFGRINAFGGHAAGDVALVDVARAVERAVRDKDCVCRIGGDEIGVIMSDTPITVAGTVADRIRGEIASVIGPSGAGLTASIGLAAYPAHASDRDDLVRRADGAQYWAKHHGKNRVVVYDPEVVVTLGVDERIASIQGQAHLASVRALAAAVDARDPVTEHHSRNVSSFAVQLAREVGLDHEKVQLLEMAALLHDVGKIGLPDSILRKPGPLSQREWEQMHRHPVLGVQILASTRFDEILPWIRSHHERWDGAGYPDGLAGESIPVEARILALCDAFDAMTSERPYRRSLSHAAALQEIDLNLGAQFDPSLGEAFIRMNGRLSAGAR